MPRAPWSPCLGEGQREKRVCFFCLGSDPGVEALGLVILLGPRGANCLSLQSHSTSKAPRSHWDLKSVQANIDLSPLPSFSVVICSLTSTPKF